jgi:hypothetical protein
MQLESRGFVRLVGGAALLLACWMGMQGVHEAGHVVGAWVTGGRVEKVVVHPLTISRTDLAENPRPLVVAWAGPLFGTTAPVAGWLMLAGVRWRWAFVVRFFAGFCLVANGVYIGAGSFWAIGDCGEMLRHGSPLWVLWLFGVVATPAGFWLWHGEGRRFGLGAH